jgi:hypothetical protein
MKGIKHVPVSCLMAFRRALCFGGRNPQKRKRSVAKPEAISAARGADGPGIG